jgi:UDP-2,4-diacetamido-2,4,6-trideoxy-beta-L-altropyranose hydrolase
MKIAFRADASLEMGTGHLMRCLTLADALKRLNAKSRFVSRNLPFHLRSMLEAAGHEHVELVGEAHRVDDLPYSRWLGTSQAADAEETNRALSDFSWDWLVVDSYAIDARWERQFQGSNKRLLAIDDLADRRHECDALLDQTLYANASARYAGKVPVACALLLGPRYALVRDEFRHLRERVKPRSGRIERILIFFGGVDVDDYTSRAIEAIVAAGLTALHVDVAIGAQHPRRSEIETVCARHGFVCHAQTSRMAELVASADLGIGAIGSASWERCCLGLPAICVATAKNQVLIAEGLEGQGAIVLVRNAGRDTTKELADALCALIRDPARIATMSKAAAAVVDGMGVDRVRDLLLKVP